MVMTIAEWWDNTAPEIRKTILEKVNCFPDADIINMKWEDLPELAQKSYRQMLMGKKAKETADGL